MTLLERMARPDALPVMARVYLVALGTPRLAIDAATLAHMGTLYDGAEPVTAADVSALSVLREEQAPATPGIGGRAISAEAQRIINGWPKPPPPCAMCDGATWIKTVDYTDAGVTPRTDPCPDCARGAR